MKKKNEAPPPARTGPLVIVDLADRVPAMTDDALKNLHANAVRLAQGGNERQRASAAALMPLIESELATRLANAPVKKPRAAPKKKLAAAAAAAAKPAAAATAAVESEPTP